MSDEIVKYALTGYDAGVAPSRMGTLVSLSDHLAVVAAARAEIERLKWERDVWREKMDHSLKCERDTRAENERLTKERDDYAWRYNEQCDTYNKMHVALEKAEAERDEARASLRHMEGFERCTCGPCAIHGIAMLADAERDMRQRAADLVGQEARTFPDNVAWGVEDLAKAILALPISIESDDADNGDGNA